MMHADAGGASRTAMMIAAYRARASAREDRPCDDPWASSLCGEEGFDLARRFDSGFSHMELWVALRTTYLDRQVLRWTGAPGLRQVVLLGAGLDTRAARLARPGVRFFEVDQPETQAEKRRRLAGLKGYPADAAVFVPCDFEADDFVDRLRGAGFSVDQPAVFIWEGVIYYLSESAVRATTSRLATGCDPRGVLLFDFLEKRLTAEHRRDASTELTRQSFSDVGEPLTFGVNDPLPLLYEAGFRYVEVVDFNEICLGLTGTYDRERQFRFQHIALASGTVPGWLDSNR
jgi:methyltransferase (TIGR00027 family)